jgi:hypothetical protein
MPTYMLKNSPVNRRG